MISAGEPFFRIDGWELGLQEAVERLERTDAIDLNINAHHLEALGGPCIAYPRYRKQNSVRCPDFRGE